MATAATVTRAAGRGRNAGAARTGAPPASARGRGSGPRPNELAAAGRSSRGAGGGAAARWRSPPPASAPPGVVGRAWAAGLLRAEARGAAAERAGPEGAQPAALPHTDMHACLQCTRVRARTLSCMCIRACARARRVFAGVTRAFPAQSSACGSRGPPPLPASLHLLSLRLAPKRIHPRGWLRGRRAYVPLWRVGRGDEGGQVV